MPWIDWMCLDASADLAYNWEMNQVRDSKRHWFQDALEAANFAVVVFAIAKTYPIVTPLAVLFMPWKVASSLPSMIRELRVRVAERIDMRDQGKVKHSDYIETLITPDKPTAELKTKQNIKHMLTVTSQLVLGSYDPTSVTIYMFFFFILQNLEALEGLKHEVRSSFSSYEDIEPEKLRTLPWLDGCLHETLRLGAPATHHALPRISPGGLVNGEYIPKGTVVRSSLFTYGRSPRFFHDPKSFRPERWLPQGHPKYNAAFADDDHAAHHPFITGPRQCPGREVARITFRLVVAKMVWLFDMEQLSEQLDFDRDMRVYAMWMKPELRMRLVPVKRD